MRRAASSAAVAADASAWIIPMLAVLFLAPSPFFQSSRLGAVSAFSLNAMVLPIGESIQQKRFETRSCSPPRFDTFGDVLVGKWAIGSIATITKRREEAVLVADVEEVMRSCGGAVQGIREPATAATRIDSGNKKEEEQQQQEETIETSSTYLNRANDGFVFFDDGCYTMGPLSIQQHSEETAEADCDFLSCIVLPEPDSEGRTQRLVFGFGSKKELFDDGGGGLLPHITTTTTVRTKQRFGDSATSSNNSNPEGEEATPAAESTVCFIEEITKIVRCKMPGGESQPWMLQRAKWETLLPQLDEELEQSSDCDDGTTSSSSTVMKPLFWVTSEPLQDFYERLGTTATSMGDDSSEGGGIVVQSGVACPNSNTLRLLARQYKSSPSTNDAPALCGILRIEGKVRFDC